MENKLSYDELLIKVDQLETVGKIICNFSIMALNFISNIFYLEIEFRSEQI